jgi:hypothetical protein
MQTSATPLNADTASCFLQQHMSSPTTVFHYGSMPLHPWGACCTRAAARRCCACLCSSSKLCCRCCFTYAPPCCSCHRSRRTCCRRRLPARSPAACFGCRLCFCPLIASCCCCSWCLWLCRGIFQQWLQSTACKQAVQTKGNR